VLGYYLSYWLGIRRRLRRHLAASRGLAVNIEGTSRRFE